MKNTYFILSLLLVCLLANPLMGQKKKEEKG